MDKDSLLSGVLLMDVDLARLVQKECEAKGLFKNISFLEAREKLVEYSFELDDEEETDDMLEDEYSGRTTNFASRLKSEIRGYISRFSEEELRILMTASDKDNPAGSLTIRSLYLACRGYAPPYVEEESFRDKVLNFVRKFYSR